MYNSYRHRNSSHRALECRIPVSAGVHEGSRDDHLYRHEQEASAAARGSRRQRSEFARCLLERVSDTRTLLVAIDHILADGEKSPGPNGIRLTHLDRFELRSLARTLSDALRTGSYRPGPARIVHRKKTSGTGTRPIAVLNAEDQVVQRALVSVLQPFLDPTFDAQSLGFRPGCSREQALALVEHLSRETNQLAWIATDVQDAFTRVLHGRLRDVLQWHGLDEPLVHLIERIITNGTRRGILQGGSLSPLMLNTYLDFFLDRIWRRCWPNVPLVRVADDLLLLCRSFGEAHDVYRDLQDLLRAVGMNLKGTAQSSIRLLGDGMQVDWLGYRLRWNGTRLEARIAERSWARFRENLQEAHLGTHAPVLASESILGWVDQLGPCFGNEPLSPTYAKVQQIASEEGFEEIPTEREFAGTWERAALHCRATWHALQLQRIGERNPELHVNQSQRVSQQASAGRSIDAFLYTDGSCCPRTRIGGWAFVLEGPIIGRQVLNAGSSPRTTNT